MLRSLLLRLLPCAVLISVSGCAHVAPYEREQLSKPTMDVAERERRRQAFLDHVYDAREGAIGSTGHTGGGCGCN